MTMTTSMRRFLKQLVSSFFLLNIVRRFKSRSSLVKIEAAKLYVLGVKKTRLFLLGALFMFVSFVFLINGLSLIQTAFFTYSMWSNEKKFVMALILGGVEFLGATGILIYLFREETWSKFSGINKVVNSAIVTTTTSNQ
jgi:hypothetical protein